jgi:hypothetical protein
VRTTTPLQALALLNEPTNLAASKGLARRMLAIAADDRSRLEYGMRCCVGRVPSDREIEVLVGLLARMRADRAPRFEPARNFLGPLDRESRNAEYLAWSDVASVLLNLDETSTRG